MKYLLLAVVVAVTISTGASTGNPTTTESLNAASSDNQTSNESDTQTVAISEGQSTTSDGQTTITSDAEAVVTTSAQDGVTSVATAESTATAKSIVNSSDPETKSAKCNGPYEVYDLCPPRTLQSCASLGYQITCPIKVKSSDCKPACRCIEGYYRNQYGDCVPEWECPLPNFAKCSFNETYSTCANGGCFGATYCSEIGTPMKCTKSKHCYQGCICKKGYLRDDEIGNCILEQDCQVSCAGDKNARPGCGVNYGRHCSDYQYYQDSNNNNISPMQSACYPGGCDCKPGYLFDDAVGRCVAPLDCTKTCTGPNEFYDLCPGCSPQTCASIGLNTTCPIGPAVCRPACRCRPGHYRNQFGVCVPEGECPCRVGETFLSSDGCNMCRCVCGKRKSAVCTLKDCNVPVPANQTSCNGDPNSQRGCGTNCGRLCSNYDSKEPVVCILSCDINGCDCKKGYVFDEVTKKCVLPQECSRYKCNKPHEIYDPCPDCSLQTCETIFGPTCPWQPTRQCEGQCRCEPGYYKNKIGECISIEECLKCTGPHEYYSCGVACDNICKDLAKQNQTSCPIVNVKCNEMCYCEEGYARNEQGICIPIAQCPVIVEPICGANEKLDNCYNGGCFGARTCAEAKVGRPVICVDLLEGHCEQGCVCVDGYLRDDRGRCVPAQQCPPKKCPGKYEEHTSCINGGCFSARKCSERGRPEFCVRIPTELCRPGCLCQKGYLRNRRGHCVPEHECPLVRGGHQYDDNYDGDDDDDKEVDKVTS